MTHHPSSLLSRRYYRFTTYYHSIDLIAVIITHEFPLKIMRCLAIRSGLSMSTNKKSSRPDNSDPTEPSIPAATAEPLLAALVHVHAAPAEKSSIGIQCVIRWRASAADKFLKPSADVIIRPNAKFYSPLLKGECRRHGITFPMLAERIVTYWGI